MSAVTSRALELEKAQPGMVLAEPVTDQKQVVLLPKGTTLSDSLLAGLARRGVARIMVAAEAVLSGPLSEHQQKLAKLRVEYLFRRAGDDPTTRALEAAIMDYRLGGKK
jgi:hypothetical protein